MSDNSQESSDKTKEKKLLPTEKQAVDRLLRDANGEPETPKASKPTRITSGPDNATGGGAGNAYYPERLQGIASATADSTSSRDYDKGRLPGGGVADGAVVVNEAPKGPVIEAPEAFQREADRKKELLH